MNKEESQKAFQAEYSGAPGIKKQVPQDKNLKENKHGVANKVEDLKTAEEVDILDTVGEILTDTSTINFTYDNTTDPKTIEAETIGQTTTFTIAGFTFTFLKGLLTNVTNVSTSPSVSPSSSVSPSASLSPSVSPSQSPSASTSPSSSVSPSASISPSVSPSISPSVSPSVSPS